MMISLRFMIGDASVRRFAILAAVVAVVAFTGGSYRPTAPTLLLLRPVVAIGLVVLLAMAGPYDWRDLRVPGALLLCFAASMLLQLVPLPLSWWLELAGHARYAVGAKASGGSAFATSLTPDLTVNSLLALLPAACVLLAYSGMRAEHRRATIWLVVGLAAVSLVFALGQIGATSGIGYIYGTHQDYVGGIMANRNHQAVLLAATLPVLAVTARQLLRGRHGRIAVAALGALGIVTLPIILLTGSRQGLALTGFAIVAAILLAPRPAPRTFGRFTVGPREVALTLVVLTSALVVAALISGQAVSIERLTAAGTVADDARWRNLPTVVAVTRDFFPIGTGYGSFDAVYRGFEPDNLLHASYFNHAHNDLLETIMTGGLPAVVLLVALLIYLATRTVGMIRRDADKSRQALFLDRAGMVIVVIILAASLVDYPLRTAVISMVFTLAVCWIAAPPAAPSRGTRSRVSSDRAGIGSSGSSSRITL